MKKKVLAIMLSTVLGIVLAFPSVVSAEYDTGDITLDDGTTTLNFANAGVGYDAHVPTGAAEHDYWDLTISTSCDAVVEIEWFDDYQTGDVYEVWVDSTYLGTNVAGAHGVEQIQLDTGDTYEIEVRWIYYQTNQPPIAGGSYYDITFTVIEQICGVQVVLFNGDEILDDPHKVYVYGSGYYTSGDRIPEGDLPAPGHLYSGNIYGPQQIMDPATDDGDDPTKLELEYATVHVTLHNDGVELTDPHKVFVYGSGYYYTCETFHVPPSATIYYHLYSGSIYGPQQTMVFDAGENEWELEYATVHVTLYNDVDGDGIDEKDKLDDPHKVFVSGSGYYYTCDTFHVPPDATIYYHLYSGNIYGPQHSTSFTAGEYEWELEFATVHVTLYNDVDEDGIQEKDWLDDPHKVFVSGSDYYITCETFHVPPGATIYYRLYSGSIYGPQQTTSFSAGDNEWELEYATVHVKAGCGSKVAISGLPLPNEYVKCDTFHVPPDTDISYRLNCCDDDGYGDSQVIQFPAGFTEWELCRVEVDIKPTSCRNPLNVKGKGVLPVAVLGTADFDVNDIDPATVRLEGVTPLRWALEDVTRPFDGTAMGCEDCTEEGPDGFLDLTLKFDTQAIVAELGPVEDGQCMELCLTLQLLNTNGTTKCGSDWVVILKKGK